MFILVLKHIFTALSETKIDHLGHTAGKEQAPMTDIPPQGRDHVTGRDHCLGTERDHYPEKDHYQKDFLLETDQGTEIGIHQLIIEVD